jgi:hypothetical protein
MEKELYRLCLSDVKVQQHPDGLIPFVLASGIQQSGIYSFLKRTWRVKPTCLGE